MNMMQSESLATRALKEVKGSMTRAHYKELRFLLSEGEYGIVLTDALKVAVQEHILIPESLLNDLDNFLSDREPVRHVPAMRKYSELLRNSVAA